LCFKKKITQTFEENFIKSCVQLSGESSPVELTANIKEGNTKVYEQVYVQYRAKVYTYLLSKTRNETIAEELAQVTFIKLWNCRQSLSADYPFDTQLFRMAASVLIDHCRKEARRTATLRAITTEQEETYLPDFSMRETNSRIHAALESLPPARKEAFVLSRIEGLSYKQIAQELSISDRTVEKHISLALRQLKKVLLLLLLHFFYFF